MGPLRCRKAMPLVAFLLAAAAALASVVHVSGQSRGGSGENMSQRAGVYLSDPSNWAWPVANLSQSDKSVHDTLAAWCGRAYEDRIREASEKTRQHEQLQAESLQRFEELTRCLEERRAREKELEVECTRLRQLLLASFDFDRVALKAECHAELELLRSDLAACDAKLKTKERVICEREVQVEKGACERSMLGLKANLTACEEKVGGSEVASKQQHLQREAEEFEREKRQWEEEERRLEEEVSKCRPARAHLEARLREVASDSTVEQLSTAVVWLQLLLGITLVLLAAAVAVGAVLAVKEANKGTGDYGWVSVLPPGKLRLVSGERARDILELAYEVRSASRLPLLLASPSGAEAEASGPVVFFLVPVNISSSRRFSLFNSTGDYVKHTERALEIVSKAMPKARLVCVLYEASGCVFTEETFQSLGLLNADKIAYESIPKDMDFPKSQNLVALWLDKVEGLRATDSERESDLTPLIRSQPWAQFLLSRSGRWGQAYAQE